MKENNKIQIFGRAAETVYAHDFIAANDPVQRTQDYKDLKLELKDAAIDYFTQRLQNGYVVRIGLQGGGFYTYLHLNDNDELSLEAVANDINCDEDTTNIINDILINMQTALCASVSSLAFLPQDQYIAFYKQFERENFLKADDILPMKTSNIANITKYLEKYYPKAKIVKISTIDDVTMRVVDVLRQMNIWYREEYVFENSTLFALESKLRSGELKITDKRIQPILLNMIKQPTFARLQALLHKILSILPSRNPLHYEYHNDMVKFCLRSLKDNKVESLMYKFVANEIKILQSFEQPIFHQSKDPNINENLLFSKHNSHNDSPNFHVYDTQKQNMNPIISRLENPVSQVDKNIKNMESILDKMHIKSFNAL